MAQALQGCRAQGTTVCPGCRVQRCPASGELEARRNAVTCPLTGTTSERRPWLLHREGISCRAGNGRQRLGRTNRSLCSGRLVLQSMPVMLVAAAARSSHVMLEAAYCVEAAGPVQFSGLDKYAEVLAVEMLLGVERAPAHVLGNGNDDLTSAGCL
eukprot:CAMPEP_0172680808 /NCGR_PEP_ID=MMETSP1074-20121228/17026_1 /TAXON_ID=2916 /ORGANISM="Ceratium fusus, Strain PA161109" /LENGTH=155 /DNA_ID=CAMNT_0013499201 /DNA_START=30 /DNA_END=496 /DNA_ORIENTATION=-